MCFNFFPFLQVSTYVLCQEQPSFQRAFDYFTILDVLASFPLLLPYDLRATSLSDQASRPRITAKIALLHFPVTFFVISRGMQL